MNILSMQNKNACQSKAYHLHNTQMKKNNYNIQKIKYHLFDIYMSDIDLDLCMTMTVK